MNKIILFLALSIILTSFAVEASDFRNLYGIIWKGNPCDNLRYAQSMGYDYVFYQYGMKDCADNLKQNLHFYIESPEFYYSNYHYYAMNITRIYSQNEIDSYNDFYAWKGNVDDKNIFPFNLAYGWWFTNITFRANPDFQQQRVIDLSINDIINRINSYEDKAIGWEFGGYGWDVPDFDGDWWTERQSGYTGSNWMCGNRSCQGKTGNIGMWNDGVESSGLHDDITHEYETYSEGRIEMMIQLFDRTKKTHPDLKLYYQPYNINTFLQTINTQTLINDIIPYSDTFICQESAKNLNQTLMFMTDNRIYESGKITKDYVCNDNPDNHEHENNLAMMATASVNGAWTGWFGRIGGTGGTTNYRINDLPARLKLVRIIAGWDNLNNVPLEHRVWDKNKQVYQSDKSYADLKVIYSTHPKNQNIYFVILDDKESLFLPEGVTTNIIYSVNEFFEPTDDSTDDFLINENMITLKDAANDGEGYVIVPKNIDSSFISEDVLDIQMQQDFIFPLQEIEQHTYLTEQTYVVDDFSTITTDAFTKFLVGISSVTIIIIFFGVVSLFGFLFHKMF